MQAQGGPVAAAEEGAAVELPLDQLIDGCMDLLGTDAGDVAVDVGDAGRRGPRRRLHA